MKKISGCLISLFCLLGIFGCAYGISPAEISMNNIMQYTPDMKPGDVPMIVRPGVSGPSGVKGTNLATSAQMNSVTQAVDVLNANRLIVNLAGHFTNVIFTTKPAKYNEHYDYAFTNGGYTHQIYFASAGLWKLTINPDLHVYTNLSTSYNVPETGWLDESGSAVGVVITNRLGAVYAEEQTRILNDGSIQEDMGFMMTTLFGKALPINTYSNYVYRVSGSDITDLNGDYYYGSSGGNFYWEKVGALNIYRLQRVLDVLTEKRKYTLLEVNSPYKVYYKNTNTINTITFKMPPPITSWETNETATTAISVDLLYLSPIEAQARIAADNTKVSTNILTTYTVADASARKAIASPFLGMRVVQTDENVAGYPTVLYTLNAADPSLDASWLPTPLANPETGIFVAELRLQDFTATLPATGAVGRVGTELRMGDGSVYDGYILDDEGLMSFTTPVDLARVSQPAVSQVVSIRRFYEITITFTDSTESADIEGLVLSSDVMSGDITTISWQAGSGAQTAAQQITSFTNYLETLSFTLPRAESGFAYEVVGSDVHLYFGGIAGAKASSEVAYRTDDHSTAGTVTPTSHATKSYYITDGSLWYDVTSSYTE